MAYVPRAGQNAGIAALDAATGKELWTSPGSHDGSRHELLGKPRSVRATAPNVLSAMKNLALGGSDYLIGG